MNLEQMYQLFHKVYWENKEWTREKRTKHALRAIVMELKKLDPENPLYNNILSRELKRSERGPYKRRPTVLCDICFAATPTSEAHILIRDFWNKGVETICPTCMQEGLKRWTTKPQDSVTP